MDFFSISELKQIKVIEGITLKSVSKENAMMTFFDFEEGSEIPLHSHPHEQITYVLKGEMDFTLGGVTKRLSAGDGVVIGSGVEHGAKIVSGPASAVDAWHPAREDYRL